MSERTIQIAIAIACAVWAAAIELAPRAIISQPALVACGHVDTIEIVEGRRTIRARARDSAAPWIEVEIRTSGGGPVDVLAVRGSGEARAAIDAVGALQSLRALGELGEDDAALAGLAGGAGSLSVRCRGDATPIVLALGAATGPGQRRVRGDDGVVHLVDGRAISELVAAEVRLQDRALIGEDLRAPASIELRVGDAVASLRRSSLGDRGPSYARADGAMSEDATRLGARLARLSAHGWIAEGDPDPEGLSPALEIALVDPSAGRTVIAIACAEGARPRCLVSGGLAAPDRAYVVPALAHEILALARALSSPAEVAAPSIAPGAP